MNTTKKKLRFKRRQEINRPSPEHTHLGILFGLNTFTEGQCVLKRSWVIKTNSLFTYQTFDLDAIILDLLQ
jgi:hypothetical protein